LCWGGVSWQLFVVEGLRLTLWFVSANNLMRTIAKRVATARGYTRDAAAFKICPDDGEGDGRLTQLDPRFPSGWL
jgi:hypothetical protein